MQITKELYDAIEIISDICDRYHKHDNYGGNICSNNCPFRTGNNYCKLQNPPKYLKSTIEEVTKIYYYIE